MTVSLFPLIIGPCMMSDGGQPEKDLNTVFIDQPTGVGYSYTDSSNQIVRDDFWV